MKQELSKDGYERIEAHIQEIENKVSEGIFNPDKALKQLQGITFETKRFRQTLREVIILNPNGNPYEPPGAA